MNSKACMSVAAVLLITLAIGCDRGDTPVPNDSSKADVSGVSGDKRFDKPEPMDTMKQNLRIVLAVGTYIERGLAGDRDNVAAVCVPGQAVVKQAIEDLPEIPNLTARCHINECRIDGDTSIAMSDPVGEPDEPMGSLVFTLVRSGDQWLIKDVDLADEKGLAETIARFSREHPQALVSRFK